MSIDNSVEGRVSYIDNVAGFLQIHVIVLHTATLVVQDFLNTNWMIFPSITFFAMPWFFFKAGMFHNSENTNKSKLKIKKICVEYFIYSIVSVLFVFLVISVQGQSYPWFNCLRNFLYKGDVYLNYALWFFPTFILTKIITYKWNLCSLSYKYIIIAVIFSVSYFLYVFDFCIPLYFENIFEALFYYIIGYHLKDYQFDIRVIIISVILIILYLIYPSWVSMPYNKVVYGNYFVGYLGAIAGIILTNNIFKHIPNINCLDYIGKNSLPIFALHMNLIVLYYSLFKMFGIDHNWVAILVLLLTFSSLKLLVLSSNYLKYDFYKK